MLSQINQNVTSFFDPKQEKAACGVGFIVNIDGIASHQVRFFKFAISLENDRRKNKSDYLTFDVAGHTTTSSSACVQSQAHFVTLPPKNT